MCGSPCAMLWTRPRDPEPGALPGRAGEKAGSHGGLDAPAAVAAGGSVSAVAGPLQIEIRHDNRCAARHAGSQSDRKSTRLNSSHLVISYAVFCLKKKKTK